MFDHYISILILKQFVKVDRAWRRCDNCGNYDVPKATLKAFSGAFDRLHSWLVAITRSLGQIHKLPKPKHYFLRGNSEHHSRNHATLRAYEIFLINSWYTLSINLLGGKGSRRAWWVISFERPLQGSFPPDNWSMKTTNNTCDFWTTKNRWKNKERPCQFWKAKLLVVVANSSYSKYKEIELCVQYMAQKSILNLVYT